MTVSFARLPCPESPIRRLDPRWKLAGLVLAAFAVAALHAWPPAVVALGIALRVAALSRLPRSWLLARLGGVGLVLLPFAVSLPFLLTDPGPPLVAWGWLEVSAHGLEAAVTLCARALAIVTLTLVLLATAPFDATLKAAHALRTIDVVTAELVQMRIALRTRGYRNRATRHSYRTIGHVTGTLLVRGAERAERVGQAMRCRGFDGQFRSLTQFHTTATDVLAFLGLVVAFVGLVVWDRLAF
jgi:cobalt/nickel transport system permease protein